MQRLRTVTSLDVSAVAGHHAMPAAILFYQKFENLFFGSNCSSFILLLNAENRINIRAVYNKTHVFKFFSVWDLYGSDPLQILSIIGHSMCYCGE